MATLNVALVGKEPPREFRVFAPGVNRSSKGAVVFDAAAAKSVMADFVEHGADMMVDLEHLSLDTESKSFDPDARGWAKLEVRDDGSLWAVDVRWTPDGEMRLREARQRYMSPAFDYEPKSKRVTRILNVAITALPATHQLTPLVAASAVSPLGVEEENVTKEHLQKALEAIKTDDKESAIAILEALVLEAASGDTVDAVEEDVVDEVASETPKPEDDEDKKSTLAASARLMRLSQTATVTAAFDEIARWKKSHDEIEGERAAIEMSDRKKLAAQLVALGAETPHTSGLANKKLCKRLVDEPIVELRSRVLALSAARGHKPPTPPTTATSTPADGGADVNVKGTLVKLSAREVAICAENKTDIAVYAANKLASGRVKTA